MLKKVIPDRKHPELYRCKRIPKIGDVIYVRTSVYLSHGVDDFVGGKAKVSNLEVGISGGQPAIFIAIEERPGWSMNWEFLETEQERLKKEFKNGSAHANPDYLFEFNRWD